MQELAMGAKLPVRWWTLFESEALNELVERAIADSQTLAAARASVEQAQAIAQARTGARGPQLDLTASSGRQKYGSQFLGGIEPPPPFTYFAFGTAVSYTFDYTGGVARSIEREQALAEYERQRLRAAQLSITGAIVQQALEIAARQAEIATVEQLLSEDRRNLEMIETAFSAGSASRVDLLSARSQLASDETLLPKLRRELDGARHALASLSGTAPAIAPPADFLLSEFVLPQRLPVSLPSELVHRRPDVLAAEAQLHAATAAVGIATANLYPHITLTASFSQQALKVSELFDSSSHAWGLIGGLTAPVFDGGRLRAERRAALAGLSAQAARYQQVVIESFAQVADALSAIEHGAEQFEAQAHALKTAQESLDLTRESYHEGYVGVLQVLDSERSYQQARLGYVRARAARLLDTAHLFVALGAIPPDAALPH